MFVLSKTSTSVLHYSSYVCSSQYPETGRLRFGVQKVISDKKNIRSDRSDSLHHVQSVNNNLTLVKCHLWGHTIVLFHSTKILSMQLSCCFMYFELGNKNPKSHQTTHLNATYIHHRDQPDTGHVSPQDVQFWLGKQWQPVCHSTFKLSLFTMNMQILKSLFNLKHF